MGNGKYEQKIYLETITMKCVNNHYRMNLNVYIVIQWKALTLLRIFRNMHSDFEFFL